MFAPPAISWHFSLVSLPLFPPPSTPAPGAFQRLHGSGECRWCRPIAGARPVCTGRGERGTRGSAATTGRAPPPAQQHRQQQHRQRRIDQCQGRVPASSLQPPHIIETHCLHCLQPRSIHSHIQPPHTHTKHTHMHSPSHDAQPPNPLPLCLFAYWWSSLSWCTPQSPSPPRPALLLTPGAARRREPAAGEESRTRKIAALPPSPLLSNRSRLFALFSHFLDRLAPRGPCEGGGAALAPSPVSPGLSPAGLV